MVAENRTPQTLMDALRHFTPEVADAYVRGIKWPDGPVCPKCGSVSVGTIKSRGRFQCRERECRHQFSLIADTIFAGTHLRLDQWIVGAWMIVNCRNGVSSCEIARAIGCKQQSAWHLLHRVRHILKEENARLMGIGGGVVEADWTYVGGLQKFMSHARRKRAKESKYYDKALVHAMKERRTGTVRANVIPNLKWKTIRDQFTGNVAPGARVYTDESWSYNFAGWKHQHHRVNHQERYVDGTVHVNGCENFFNTLRRGLKGTYIAARADHLDAYVTEQVYRFNHRKETDWERFSGAMRLIIGKRLTYSALTDGAVR